jgi:myo-inositol-1(or 4)-monophosphatase
MPSSEIERRWKFACEVGREAGELAQRLFLGRSAGSFELKGHQDYLTEADGQVERLVMDRIAAAFPQDSVLGEEGGGHIGERTWVIDPIDGTANFARGMPHFCVSIGYVESNRKTIGVISNPLADEFYAAVLGGGATLNGAPMKVSTIADMPSATVELGWSSRLPMADYIAMVRKVTDTGAGFLRRGSGALALASVAAGRIDGYAELHINSWDTVAALLMVEEAGGWANDFLAGDGMASGNPVLACTPALRGALVEATGITI